MNESTTQNQPVSENLSTAGLAARLLASQIAASSAPGTSAAAPTSPASPETTAALQQTAAGTEEAPPNSPAAAAPPAPTEEEVTPGAEETALAEEDTPPPVEPGAEEDHEAEAEKEALLPKDHAVKSLQKRVGKVTRQRYEALAALETERATKQQLEQQVQQLHEQVTQLRTGTPPNVRAIDRFSGHPAVRELDARLSNVDATLAWCDANPEGGDVAEAEGRVRTFAPEEVRRIQRQVERDRASLIAERAQKVGRIEDAENTRRQAADVKARKTYPWLASQQSPEFQTAVQIGREIPGLLQHPEFVLHMGDLVRGRLAREAEEKKGLRPVAPAKRPNTAAPPNVTTTPVAAPRASNALEVQVSTAEEEYRKVPTLANYQTLTRLKSRLQVQAPHRAAA